MPYFVVAFVIALFFPIKSSFAIDRNNWMSEIYDDAKISWLTIPGTHDTATFNLSDTTKKYATTQSMSIEQQLAAGIRAFDLRYKWESDGKFYIYHGDNENWTYKCRDTNGNHLDLATVFSKIQTFLNAHPNEFVLVNIQHELGDYNSTVVADLNNLISSYGIVSRNTSTTVGEVRGKMVNGSSFMQNVVSQFGIEYNRWEGSVDEKVSDLKTVFSAAPSITKYYSSSITQKCICTNLSWRSSSLFTGPDDYAESVHKQFFGSNPFSSYGQKAYGVIFYDFPSNTIIDWTISANDWAKSITCTIKYNSGKGSSVAGTTVKECSLLVKPNDPVLNYYTFSGWYKNSSYTQEWNFLSDKAKDATTTLYAKWTPVTYKITYSGIGGAVNPNTSKSTYTVETETYTLKDATKAGWKFLGWYDSDNNRVTQIKKGSGGDVSLKAKWEIVNYEINYKNVEGAINQNDVSTYNINSQDIELKDAEKDHYVFNGWFDANGKQVSKISKGSTGNISLTAKWTPVNYSITYKGVTEGENPNKVVSYNVETTTINLNNPKRAGYVFLGWFDEEGNKVTSIEKGSFGDIVLTASWASNNHTITYSGLDGAENPNKVTTFSADSDTIYLKDPIRQGYVFDGWYSSSGYFVTEIVKGTDEDVALTATWTPVRYVITYSDPENGTNPNETSTFTVESPTINLKDCTKSGYVFEGWFEKDGTASGNWGKKITQIKKGNTGDVELFAKWTKTVSMMRLYNPNSGEHFYTGDVVESDNLVALGWKSEGVGWVAPEKSSKPVYRLYNPNSGDHHYTTSLSEKNNLVKVGWSYEGIGWYSDEAQSVALYRQYNPNADVGTHNYTTSLTENNKLVKIGWKAEGIGWYGLK